MVSHVSSNNSAFFKNLSNNYRDQGVKGVKNTVWNILTQAQILPDPLPFIQELLSCDLRQVLNPSLAIKQDFWLW